MKRFLKLFGLMLFGVMLLSAIAFTASSCEGVIKEKRRSFLLRTHRDSVEFTKMVQKSIEELPEPVRYFKDGMDVISYKQQFRKCKQADSLLFTLSDGVIYDIASVLKYKTKGNPFTVFDLLHEYETNAQIYDGLHNSQPPSVVIVPKNKNDTVKIESITPFASLQDSTQK